MSDTEARVGEWRTAISRSRAIDDNDVDELESHLRDQIADLEKVGLSDDEAFLVAVKRLGEVDAVTAEYAREHGDRLWKQLALPRADGTNARPFVTMLVFAALAAVLLQAARLIGGAGGDLEPWVIRDAGLLVLTPLVGYFAVRRRMPGRRLLPVALIVVALAIALTVFPFAALGADGPGATTLIVALHLPVLLWFLVGATYAGGDVGSHPKRMDFIRFTGEWVVYYALIALGGAVLIGLTVAVLTPIAPDAVEGVIDWVLPTGAAGAVVVAAWLVEEKKSLIENLAPVLTMIFTPLFAAMLLVAAVGYAITGIGRTFDRELLVVFDILLIVVLGLVVYGISARAAGRMTRVLDVLRTVAVIAAVLLDVLVLIVMLQRVGDFGFTANRVAALGLNLVLLVNLVVTAVLSIRMLAARSTVAAVERWQTGYLPVFAGWVALVVLVLPPVFGFA